MDSDPAKGAVGSANPGMEVGMEMKGGASGRAAKIEHSRVESLGWESFTRSNITLANKPEITLWPLVTPVI